jgi:hypothetical protein
MTRLVRRSIVVALALSGFVAFGGGLSASAHAYVRAGWWSRTNQGSVDLSTASPSPPPAGGLAVGATPEGTIAMSAVRFTVAADEANARLTLPVDPSSTNADAEGVAIVACRSGSSWSAGDAQAWDTAPPAACSASSGGGSVLGHRSQDGAAWSFELGALTVDGAIDIVLVPATSSGAPPVAPYQVNFGVPTADALTTSSATSGDTPSSSYSQPPGPEMHVTGDGVAAPEHEPAAVETPDLVAAGEPSAPELRADAGPLTPSVPGVGLRTPPLPTVPRAPSPTPSWVRLLAVLLTVVACGALYDGLRPEPESGEPEMRGVGDLVAPRSGPPPAL